VKVQLPAKPAESAEVVRLTMPGWVRGAAGSVLGLTILLTGLAALDDRIKHQLVRLADDASATVHNAGRAPVGTMLDIVGLQAGDGTLLLIFFAAAVVLVVLMLRT